MAPTAHAHDDRRDRHAHLAASLCVVATFYTITTIYLWSQTLFHVGAVTETSWARYGANLASSLVLAAALAVIPAHRSRTVVGALPGILLATVPSAAARLALFVWWGVIPWDRGVVVVESLAGLAFGVGGACLGFGYTAVRRRERAEALFAAEAGYQRELALRTLENEEVRVRRSIAEGLHGSLQQRLVIAAVQVDLFVAESRRRGLREEDVEPLLALRAELEDIRENDVRATSRMLYPEGIEIGVVPAVRMLLRRLPTGIATRLHVSDALRRLDDPGNSQVRPADRLLVVRVVEEAVTNGLRHGHATSFDVTIDLEDGATIVVDVANNGAPVDPEQVTHGSGTRRLRDRVELAGGTLDVGSDAVASRTATEDADGRTAHHAHLRARVPVTIEPITGIGHLPTGE